MNDDTKLFYG